MRNAKEELQKVLDKISKTCDEVIAYKICYVRSSIFDDGSNVEVSGKGPITDDDWNMLENINYSSGYGWQRLYGLILFTDNSWLERGEYDGSEWWEYKKAPTVWEVLKYSPRDL